MGPGIKIELVVAADGAVRSIRTVDGTLVTLGQTGEKQSKKLGGAIDHFIGGIAVRAAQRLVGGLKQVSKFLFEASAASEAAASKFKLVFEEGAEMVQHFLETYANMAGITITEGQEMTSMFGAMFRGMGFTGGAAGNLSTRVLQLAMDMQSFNNIKLDELLPKLQSGLLGIRKPLDSLGIGFSQLEVKQRAAEMTGRSVKDTFDQQELVLARLSVLLDKTTVQHDNMVNTVGETANQARAAWGLLKQRVDDLADALLPAFNQLATGANTFLQANEEAITGTVEGIATVVFGVMKGVTEFVGILAEAKKFLSEYSGTIKVVTGLFGAYVLWISRATIATKLFNLVSRINPVLAIVSGLILAIGVFRRYRATIHDAEATLLDWAASAFDTFKDFAVWIVNISSALPELFGGAALRENGLRLLSLLNRGSETLRVNAEHHRIQAEAIRKQKDETSGAEIEARGYLTTNEELAEILDKLTRSEEASTEAVKKKKTALSAAEREARRVAEALQLVTMMGDPFLRVMYLAPRTIKEAETTMSLLNTALREVDTQGARDEILAYISILEGLIQTMRGVQTETKKTETTNKDSMESMGLDSTTLMREVGDNIVNLAGQVADGTMTMGGALVAFVGALANMGMRVGMIMITSGKGLEALKKLSGSGAILAGSLLIAASLAARAAISRAVGDTIGGGGGGGRVIPGGTQATNIRPGFAGITFGGVPATSATSLTTPSTTGDSINRLNGILNHLATYGIEVHGETTTGRDTLKQMIKGQNKFDNRMGYS